MGQKGGGGCSFVCDETFFWYIAIVVNFGSIFYPNRAALEALLHGAKVFDNTGASITLTDHVLTTGYVVGRAPCSHF